MQFRLLIHGSVVLVIVVCAAVSLNLNRPPEPVSDNAGLEVFSAERAKVHVDAMCSKPHASGTPAHASVRQYILDQLELLGLPSEVQVTTVTGSHSYNQAIKVWNVIARLKGTEGDKAVALVGHYDTQPNTKGAADDGSAVATMLETARALTNSASLRNDVLFVFTDAEELGLLGARAFVDEHPAFKDIGLILNFEARGNSGASLMFEVSPNNGWLMREFKKAVSHPNAASVMYEVYKQMPHDTDFTVFREREVAGFNFGFLNGFAHYHNMTDSPLNLDLGSLQHHGAYAMDITRHFGNLSLEQTKQDDVVYFNPVGSWLVVLPAWMNHILTGIVVAMFVVFFGWGLKKGRVTVKGALGAVGIYVVSIPILCVLTWLLQRLIAWLYPHYTVFYLDDFYNSGWYTAFYVALTIALLGLVLRFVFSGWKLANVAIGGLAIGLILAVVLAIFMPTATYLVTYPLLFGLAGWLICLWKNLDEDHQPDRFWLVLLGAVIPALLFFPPFVETLFVGMAHQKAYVGVAMLLVAVAFILPQIKPAFLLHRYGLSIVAFAVAVVCFMGGHLASKPDAEHPLQSNVMYSMCTDSNRAWWVSSRPWWVSETARTDEWNQQFFKNLTRAPLTEIYPNAGRIRLKNEAPVAKLPPPTLQVLENTPIPGARKLLLKLNSPRQAAWMEIGIDATSKPGNISINNKKVAVQKVKPEEGEYLWLTYYGLDDGGMELELESNSQEDLEIIVVDQKLGLPKFEGLAPMPAHVIPDTDYDSNLTIVKKTFHIQ